jgi:glycosyltransferase involved in cell wall biosynthesis
LQIDLQNAYKNAYKIYYPALFNKNSVENYFNIKNNNDNNIIIQQQGLLKINKFINKTKNECIEIFKEKYFKLPEDKKIIINIGFGDYRKGFDIFYQSSKLKENENYFFLWIGNINFPFKNNDNFKLMDHIFDVGLFYKIADLFFLSSREDPFPNVINEASDSDLKILAFNGATGAGEFIKENNGCLINFSKQVILDKINFINLTEDFTQRKLTIDNLCQNILSNTTNFKKVSVIVPNYNHEAFIEQRLQSIYQQDYPIYEIIFLDDCSSDQSLNHAYKSLRENKVKFKIIKNDTNNEKVFHQWKKGILEATGDLCWIAESDDLSEINFLSETVKAFSYDDVVLSYSNSKICDENGTITSNDYQFYLKQFHEDKWRYNYLENGNDEIRNYLVHQNHIMNVSSCIFDLNHAKQIVNEDIFEETSNYFTDWLFYIYLIKNKKIHYNSNNLNIHRRFKESIFGQISNDTKFNLDLEYFKTILKKYI